jgi:cytochrome c-type biogenesis protein CcmH/NrfG
MLVDILLLIVIILLVIILWVQIIHLKAFNKSTYGSYPDLQILFAKKSFQRILDKTAEKLATSPSEVELFWYQGLAHFHLNDFDNARTALMRAVELDPSYKNSVTPYLEHMEREA